MYIFNKCRVVLLCVLMATSLVSCDENAELRDQYNALFTEVIDLHDELMPKMSNLSEFQEQLERVGGSCSSLRASSLSPGARWEVYGLARLADRVDLRVVRGGEGLGSGACSSRAWSSSWKKVEGAAHRRRVHAGRALAPHLSGNLGFSGAYQRR